MGETDSSGEGLAGKELPGKRGSFERSLELRVKAFKATL
jgi:hypothetical protein